VGLKVICFQVGSGPMVCGGEGEDVGEVVGDVEGVAGSEGGRSENLCLVAEDCQVRLPEASRAKSLPDWLAA